MGLINWIFDIYQHTKIDEARKEAMEARLEAARVNQGGSVDAQRLLVEKGVCTNDEFRNTVQRIDAEDGIQDGRSPIG